MPANPTPPPPPVVTKADPAKYAAAAKLLADTERHTDPTIRAVRRIAAQSLDALHTLVAGLESVGKAAQGLDEAIAAVALVRPPQLDDSPRAMLDEEPAKVDQPAGRAGKSPTALLMDHHGITADVVRAWHIDAGLEVTKTGLLARRYVDAYIDAHRPTTAN